MVFVLFWDALTLSHSENQIRTITYFAFPSLLKNSKRQSSVHNQMVLVRTR